VLFLLLLNLKYFSCLQIFDSKNIGDIDQQIGSELAYKVLICLAHYFKIRYGVSMKTAVTAIEGTLASKIDPRFGRSKYFIVFDMETGEFEVTDNSINLNAAQGAGIQSAANIAGLGVEAVITGHVGPKAFRALHAAGVKIYTVTEELTVSEALERMKSGVLECSDNADVEGHWM